jgi:hypothetical protein
MAKYQCGYRIVVNSSAAYQTKSCRCEPSAVGVTAPTASTFPVMNQAKGREKINRSVDYPLSTMESSLHHAPMLTSSTNQDCTYAAGILDNLDLVLPAAVPWHTTHHHLAHCSAIAMPACTSYKSNLNLDALAAKREVLYTEGIWFVFRVFSCPLL